jgi:periplasmic divalent cation tolerance protein
MNEVTVNDDFLVVYCTCPDTTVAEQIAAALVTERLAACVNLLSGIRSVYRWEGELCWDSEVLLIIKTGRTVYADLEARLRALHPYQVPEIIALPIQHGSAAYLAWLADSLAQPA